jgi:hypothetical protein
MEEVEKQFVRRCPRLGGLVAFFYCTSAEAGQRPCTKIIDCWWETFDVLSYLTDTLGPVERDRILNARPPSKIRQLVDIIEQSKKRLVEP